MQLNLSFSCFAAHFRPTEAFETPTKIYCMLKQQNDLNMV